jgi:GH15 family glucan-1,4-alpha-glucosidase
MSNIHKIPVEGHKNLYRDKNSGAIINYDGIEYSQYIRNKNERKKKNEEIDSIKKDIEEIKSLLREVLNGDR